MSLETEPEVPVVYRPEKFLGLRQVPKQIFAMEMCLNESGKVPHEFLRKFLALLYQ